MLPEAYNHTSSYDNVRAGTRIVLVLIRARFSWRIRGDNCCLNRTMLTTTVLNYVK